MQIQDAPIIPHVLMFPLPIQGPVNSMLKLAELLIFTTNDIHVTFLTTNHVYNRLILGAQAKTRFHGNPRFSFHSFADGLPKDHPRGGQKFLEMLESVKNVSQPIFEKMLASSNGNVMSTLKSLVTCVIADGLYDFALDVGNEAGIPVLYFDTISPCCLWVYMCLPKLLKAGQVPIRENEELESLVNVVPGMENFLRRRDLPDFCRGNDKQVEIQGILAQIEQFPKAQGIILNSFEDLEPELLSYIDSYCKTRVYTIGPLHFHLQHKMLSKSKAKNGSIESNPICSNSFWEEDINCMAWLDKQQPKSVAYCSFGSHVAITKDQLIEFWHGLVNSESYFLWVKRPGSVIGMADDFEKWSEEINKDLIDGINRKGFIVSWAPQEKVLTHSSVGGFLTHSGWNSTIESITMGVPMICWPHYVDQMVISRVVSEVWKAGIDIKDTCDRVTIEKGVRDVMDLRKHEFLENATKLANMAKNSVNVKGSSSNSLECLIKDIRSFHLFTPNSSL